MKPITAQRHSQACAEEYIPSLPLGHSHFKKSYLLRRLIVVVRERWRLGYLWGLSLFGTTSLRSVFS